MKIGIAYDLKSDFDAAGRSGPEDALEEYDSPVTVEAIERALAARGHTVLRLRGGRSFVTSVLETPPDLVFNIAEGRGSRSREAHVPAVCEMLGIAYTHSDPLTMALSLDKGLAKRVAESFGVPTPRFAVVECPRDVDAVSLEYPLFAKPLFEGSSMGIRRHSKIANAAMLRERAEKLLADYGEPVLVEEFCSGPEFTVAILGSGESARVVAAMEIVPKKVAPADFVYSLEINRSDDWQSEMEYAVPPRRSPREIASIEAVALGAYRALGCRDIARIDVRTGRDGEPKFIEANPLPGIAPGWSDLALLWQRLDRSYEDLVHSIVAEASTRLFARLLALRASSTTSGRSLAAPRPTRSPCCASSRAPRPSPRRCAIAATRWRCARSRRTAASRRGSWTRSPRPSCSTWSRRSAATRAPSRRSRGSASCAACATPDRLHAR